MGDDNLHKPQTYRRASVFYLWMVIFVPIAVILVGGWTGAFGLFMGFMTAVAGFMFILNREFEREAWETLGRKTKSKEETTSKETKPSDVLHRLDEMADMHPGALDVMGKIVVPVAVGLTGAGVAIALAIAKA